MLNGISFLRSDGLLAGATETSHGNSSQPDLTEVSLSCAVLVG